MASSIGVISDPHATVAPLKEALQVLRARQVDEIYCLGDVAGYGDELSESLGLIQEYKVKCILGNHELWLLSEENRQCVKPLDLDLIKSWPAFIELSIENIKLLLTHASPPDILDKGVRLLNKNGLSSAAAFEFWVQKLEGEQLNVDVLLVGHTHQVFAEYLANILVINPGSCLYNHSCLILNLPSLEVEWISLSNKDIVKSWHWGQQVSQ